MHEGMTTNLIQIGIGHTKLTPYDIPACMTALTRLQEWQEATCPRLTRLPFQATVLGPAYLGPSCNTITTVQSG